MKSNLEPVQAFQNLPKNAKFVSFLHTGTGKNKSILAYNPIETFSYKTKDKLSFQKTLKQFIAKHTKKNHKIIGYISYDLGYELHKIKKTAEDDLKLPDIYFHAYDQWTELNAKNSKPVEIQTKKYKSTNFKPTLNKSDYNRAYKKIQHYIHEGDFYQINLTHRLEAQTEIPSRELFLKIIETNPVEFLSYIEGPNFQILSASPERFIKIKNKKIETCPVKGTRPRGKTKEKDKKLSRELIESEKEAAELNMITDLLRNDLGKISKPGSVKVEGHRLLSKCPTVWHTYSHITGTLDSRFTPIDALISMLPGGSITGCPKKRAMEVIDELEPKTRSIYTGVIGHIDSNLDLDFSIAIRTIIKKKHNLYLQVGGGIVLDSENQAEYEETLDKAASFMKILC